MAIKSTKPVRLLHRAAEIESQIAELQEKLQTLNEIPQDDFSPGDVIVFHKKFSKNSPEYTYVALKVKGGGWYLTGSIGDFDWELLMDKIYGNIGSGGYVHAYLVSSVEEIG